MFANDFAVISGTAEGLQEQVEKALEYTRKWRVTVNSNKCAVLICNEDKKKPVEFKWAWGAEELPIVDQFTYLGVEVSKNCSWDAHIDKMIHKGKAEVGRMGVIPGDSHLDTRIEICILLNVIAPNLGYAVVREGKRCWRRSWNQCRCQRQRRYKDVRKPRARQHCEQSWECTLSNQRHENTEMAI